MSALEGQLLAAHAAGDRPALARLYAQAAEGVAEAEAKGFYLTQAYVFALEVGLPEAVQYHAQLVAMGREV